jgi:hypothetical protein
LLHLQAQGQLYVATPCGNARDVIVLNEFTYVSEPNPSVS